MPKHAPIVPKGTPSDPADKRIGLTEAFSPVGDAPAPSAPSDDNDARIGLTEAFSPVGDGAHAGGFSYQGDNEDEYPDAFESLEPVDAPPLLFGDEALPVEPEEPQGRHGKKDKQDKKKKDKQRKKQQIPAYQRKSRRMRRVLIAIVVLLILLIGALGYFTFRLLGESQTLASQQTQEQQSSAEVGSINKDETKDAASTATKKTEVPDLAAVLGMTKDEAIAALKHGATETSSKEVSEEGNPVKTNVTIALTDEPADTRSGTPSVYLGLDEDGKIVQAGYSAATAALGYGSLSFVDAVKNEHIVEKTLAEAGIAVPEGTVELPADKTAYSTYDTDGTTLVKESCSFSGTVDLAGAAHEWSAVLLYDYKTANASGNLADTIRIIYVYINA